MKKHLVFYLFFLLMLQQSQEATLVRMMGIFSSTDCGNWIRNANKQSGIEFGHPCSCGY